MDLLRGWRWLQISRDDGLVPFGNSSETWLAQRGANTRSSSANDKSPASLAVRIPYQF